MSEDDKKTKAIEYIETEADFHAKLASAGEKLVVVDFTASWCGPCRQIAPKFQALAEQYETALFYKVDVDVNAETAEKQGISAMPTFLFYKNGVKVDELMGANEAKLQALVSKNL